MTKTKVALQDKADLVVREMRTLNRRLSAETYGPYSRDRELNDAVRVGELAKEALKIRRAISH